MSPKKRRRAPPANAEIVREQIQLMKTEKELKTTLEQVNEQINKLLVSHEMISWVQFNWFMVFLSKLQVEELQLKSALARSRSTQLHTTTPKVEPINAVYQFDSPINVINEQKLNLFPGKCSQSIEEYDEE